MFPQKQKSTNVYLCVDALVCLLKEKNIAFFQQRNEYINIYKRINTFRDYGRNKIKRNPRLRKSQGRSW